MTMRSTALALFALGALSTACGNNSYDDGYYGPPGQQTRPPDTILRVDIDTDAALATDDTGKGAGLFVEYAAGGAYHIFATCDTLSSNSSCQWDVLASIDPTLTLDDKDDGNLESDDAIVRVDKGAVRLFFNVDVDTDGVTLTAPPGERLRLDEYLFDPDPQKLTDSRGDAAALTIWTSGGEVKTGVPSNPVDFVPTSP